MRPGTRKWLFLLAALGVLFLASTRIEPLWALREENDLVLPPLPEEMAPSMLYSPLLALGRAPLVDILWLRATRLKEQGRFFDALQLSEQICELQPKFAAVWAFQAWNMSYNISVTFKTPEERWRWVRNGFELLRDKGIPLNPNNTQLYRELAWIYFHKVGDFMDDWHFYYKNEFAKIMESILGRPPVGYVVPGRVRGDYYRAYDYQAFADAPTSFESLLAEPGVAALVDELNSFGFDASASGIYLGLLDSVRSGEVKMPDTEEHEQTDRMHTFLQAFAADEHEDAERRLEHYWRAYRLRHEVKLDPQRIVELEKAYGVSFDYRLAEAHAFYWANLGLEMGTDKRVAMDVHRLNTNRLEFYCLQKMFHRGRLAMSPNAHLGEPPLLSPDIRVVPALRAAFVNESKEYLKRERVDKAVSENFRTGYVGFMRSAILRLHELGRDSEARELLAELSDFFPDPMYEDGLDGFLRKQIVQDQELGDYRTTLARIEALLGRGLIHYAYDEDDESGRYISRARKVYDMYQRDTVSHRQGFQFTFKQILTGMAHRVGGRMYRTTYEHLCGKLKIEPLPEPSADDPSARQ